MLAANGRLKFALQKEGRITDGSLSLLRAAGLEFDLRSKALFSPCRNFPVDILSLRDDDIPEYVQDGVSELGIVGQNVIIEKHARVTILERLGFGKCKLAVCAPTAPKIKTLKSLNGKRIATSYPATLRRFLSAQHVKAEIIEISGSVEITPSLDVADATCDIISTGGTARMNGLEVICTVLESEAVLIANTRALTVGAKRRHIDELLARVRSTLHARGKRYVMMNAPTGSVPAIQALLPGVKSPTIMPLANARMVAVHAVVGEDVFWDMIAKLTQAGASDIVVIPIEKFIA